VDIKADQIVSAVRTSRAGKPNSRAQPAQPDYSIFSSSTSKTSRPYGGLWPL
jgi:hypothetical protein